MCIVRFGNGEIGYINQVYPWWGPEDGSSVETYTRSTIPDAEVAMARPVKGPNGEGFVNFWGLGGHVVTLGAHLENQPEKVKRILEICEVLASDIDFYEKAIRGERGTHWDFVDQAAGYQGGIKMLPPYDDGDRATAEALSVNVGHPTAFAIVTPYYNLVQPKMDGRIQIIAAISSPDTGKPDMFGKADVLPSSAVYFADLMSAQLVLMTQVITGDKPLEAYTEGFAELWKQQGGLILNEEAKNMNILLENIKSQVGAN